MKKPAEFGKILYEIADSYVRLVRENKELILRNQILTRNNSQLIERLIIEVTKEADKIYPSPHGADIRKAIAFVDGGNYILNQLKTNKK